MKKQARFALLFSSPAAQRPLLLMLRQMGDEARDADGSFSSEFRIRRLSRIQRRFHFSGSRAIRACPCCFSHARPACQSGRIRSTWAQKRGE